MKQVLVKIGEIASILCLIVFIGIMTVNGTVSEASLQEVSENVVSDMDLEGALKRDIKQIRKQFGADESEMEDFLYYSCEDVMDVRELLIIRLAPDCEGDSFYSAIEKRLDDKRALFESYAPEQSAMLNGAVLVREKGFIFYAVGEDCDEAYENFKSSL